MNRQGKRQPAVDTYASTTTVCVQVRELDGGAARVEVRTHVAAHGSADTVCELGELVVSLGAMAVGAGECWLCERGAARRLIPDDGAAAVVVCHECVCRALGERISARMPAGTFGAAKFTSGPAPMFRDGQGSYCHD